MFEINVAIAMVLGTFLVKQYSSAVNMPVECMLAAYNIALECWAFLSFGLPEAFWLMNLYQPAKNGILEFILK